MNENHSPKLLTPEQFASRVCRSRRTVYRWIHEGRLTHYIKVVDGYLIPETELTKIMKEVFLTDQGTTNRNS